MPKAKAKAKKLIIQELSDGNDFEAYYAKGHWPKEQFAEAVKTQCIGNLSDVPLEEVETIYGRLIPVQGRSYDMLFTKVDGPKPGAFACTYFEP